MKKKHPYSSMTCWEPMKSLVHDEFKDIMRNGMIMVSMDEMTTVFINLLVEFNKMKREQAES